MKRFKRMSMAVLVLLVVELLAASGGTKTSRANDGRISAVTLSTRPVGSLPEGRPGAQGTWVEQGKEFDAIPDFTYFRSCGRPCWLPLYPVPNRIPGTAVTDNYPYERFGGNPGDAVHVMCQARGQRLQNDILETSHLWDRVVVPKTRVVRGADKLTLTPDGSGYYAYGNDIWLGNTGWHGIPCL